MAHRASNETTAAKYWTDTRGGESFHGFPWRKKGKTLIWLLDAQEKSVPARVAHLCESPVRHNVLFLSKLVVESSPLILKRPYPELPGAPSGGKGLTKLPKSDP